MKKRFKNFFEVYRALADGLILCDEGANSLYCIHPEYGLENSEIGSNIWESSEKFSHIKNICEHKLTPNLEKKGTFFWAFQELKLGFEVWRRADEACRYEDIQEYFQSSKC